MVPTSFLRATAVSVLLAGSGSAPAWAAFSCPTQEAVAGGDKLDLRAMPLSTNSPDLPQPVLDAIGRMRAGNVSNGRIVDTLVPAYCGRVAGDATLPDQAKAAEVERFASRLAKYLYRSPSSDEEDILIDVPVPQATFNNLAAAARRDGVSQDAWVNAAIRSKWAPHRVAAVARSAESAPAVIDACGLAGRRICAMFNS